MKSAANSMRDVTDENRYETFEVFIRILSKKSSGGIKLLKTIFIFIIVLCYINLTVITPNIYCLQLPYKYFESTHL